MFGWLKKLTSKPKEVKRFSSTTTDVYEGSNRKRDLDPEINSLLNELGSGGNISNENLNKLATFYFNTDKIEPGIFNFNKDMLDGMCFDIAAVDTVFNDDGDVSNVYITMVDTVYNADMSIRISVKDFHEFFNCLVLKGATHAK